MKEEPKYKFNVWFSNIKKLARKMKKEIGALYLAYKRQDVSPFAKAVSILVVGYALSPIDLIPDFIPVLGYVDDLVLLPLGIYFAIKLIPTNIMEECRLQAEKAYSKGKNKNWIAGIIIICVWLAVIGYVLLKLQIGR